MSIGGVVQRRAYEGPRVLLWATSGYRLSVHFAARLIVCDSRPQAMAKLDSDYSWSAALVLIIFSSPLFEATWAVFFRATVRNIPFPFLIVLFIDSQATYV